mgnify:CR=1 FL=1
MGDRILAMQFHLELGAQETASLIADGHLSTAGACLFTATSDALQAGVERHGAMNRRLLFELLDQCVALA